MPLRGRCFRCRGGPGCGARRLDR